MTLVHPATARVVDDALPAVAELLSNPFPGPIEAVVDAAEGDGQIFAYWQGTLTFPAGVMIGDVRLEQPLTVPLRGVERFRLDSQGRISELDIVHETSSIPQAARAANNRSEVK